MPSVDLRCTSDVPAAFIDFSVRLADLASPGVICRAGRGQGGLRHGPFTACLPQRCESLLKQCAS